MKDERTLWNKYYLLTVILNILISFSFYMVASIMSKHLVNIGIDVTIAGVIVGLFSITSLICRPFSGVIADTFDNILLIKISNVLMAIGLTGFAFTTNVRLLITFRIINGIGFALLGTSVITLATRYIPDGRRGEGIGYLGLGMALASAVAPGFGISIAEKFGMKTTFLISAAMCVSAILLLFAFRNKIKRNNSAEDKKCISFSLKNMLAPEALPYTVIAGTFSFLNGIIASYMILYADELGIKGISIYFTVCAVTLMVSRPMAGKIMDKKGLAITVIPGICLTVISAFMVGRVSTLSAILLTGIIRSLGQGSAQPSLQVGCINRCGKNRSGVATSTYYLGGDICQGTAPMIGGFILGNISGTAGYKAAFDLSGILMLIAGIYFVFLYYKEYKLKSSVTE